MDVFQETSSQGQKCLAWDFLRQAFRQFFPRQAAWHTPPDSWVKAAVMGWVGEEDAQGLPPFFPFTWEAGTGDAFGSIWPNSPF